MSTPGFAPASSGTSEKNRRIMTSSINNMTVAEVRKYLNECRKKHNSQSNKAPMFITDVLSNGMTVQEFALKFQQGHHQKRHNKGIQCRPETSDALHSLIQNKNEIGKQQQARNFSAPKKNQIIPCDDHDNDDNDNDDDDENIYFSSKLTNNETREGDESSIESDKSNEPNEPNEPQRIIKSVVSRKRGRPKKSQEQKGTKRAMVDSQQHNLTELNKVRASS